jgi:hypothetical protein
MIPRYHDTRSKHKISAAGDCLAGQNLLPTPIAFCVKEGSIYPKKLLWAKSGTSMYPTLHESARFSRGMTLKRIQKFAKSL